MGRKPKYDEKEIEKFCGQVAEALANGTEEKDLYKQLGIKRTTYYDYLKKYPKFADAVADGRTRAVKTVYNAVFRAAVGFSYDEEKTVARKDKKGERVIDVERYKKYAKPDMSAAAIWLRNHDPDYHDADSGAVELRRQEAELRRAIAEANNLDLEI